MSLVFPRHALECSAIHLPASCSVIKPLITSVSPSGHRISIPQPVPGIFRAMKVGRCSIIRRICADGGPIQASYPATIKLIRYPRGCRWPALEATFLVTGLTRIGLPLPRGRCGGERGTRVPAADQGKRRDELLGFPWAFGNRSLLLAKNGRLHRLGLPIEEIIKAGPGMDLGLANPAFETAGMLVRMLLSCRVVIHPATGAGEMFGGPNAACHPANMPRRPSVFQCGYPSQSN